MGKQLFGTDGIRGAAGDYPLDPPTVHRFGLALAKVAFELDASPAVLIGADTRESSPWISAQVGAGLAEAGVKVRYAGVITTPGVAYLTRNDAFVAGVMISASHNPFQDNGIKVFGHSGHKLPDHEEHEIEELILNGSNGALPPAPALIVDETLDHHYVDHLFSTLATGLGGLRLVLDCGNGAASNLAPELFRRAGADVHPLHCEPNGRNINLDCGALHVESLQKTVVERHADAGVAFDGDADRAIFVASDGRIIDGDAVLLIAARALKKAGKLSGNTVVATVMSNLGLEKALEQEGIKLLRTPVGDKYVLEEMLRTGATLGGEQSGHVILTEYATTGDGMLTALQLAGIMKETGLGLTELSDGLRVFPQRLVNVKVREKKKLNDLPGVAEEVRLCEEKLGDSGRILVRFSGTEPLARVMVEAMDQRQVDEFSQRIAGAIQREIG